MFEISFRRLAPSGTDQSDQALATAYGLYQWQFIATGPIVIGRASDCQVQLGTVNTDTAAAAVSRRHFRVDFDANSGGAKGTDLASRNGTTVNGVDSKAGMTINDGDVLGLSHARLRVSIRKTANQREAGDDGGQTLNLDSSQVALLVPRDNAKSEAPE